MNYEHLQRWKRAVVHLECATDSETWEDRHQRLNSVIEDHKNGVIDAEELSARLSGGTRDVRYHGTALFIESSGGRYLITARHVIFDEIGAKREIERQKKWYESWPENMQVELLKSAEDRANNSVYNIIFRVPSLSEVLANPTHHADDFLMNLNAGVTWNAPFTLTNAGIDLGIISLDDRDARFANHLVAYGHEPIDVTDIADAPTSEGSEIFTVGFPSATSVLGRTGEPQSSVWKSVAVSQPTFSFGHVAMLHPELPYFWGDLNIYPGNSGGPIIENDKLVGIVSSQPAIQSEITTDDGTNKLPLKAQNRIPYGRITKAQFIRDLIRVQEQKSKVLTQKDA